MYMKEIGIGIIIGLTFVSTTLILKTKIFTPLQKIFLTFCFVFPPAQWVFALLIYLFNKYNSSFNSKLSFQKTTQNIVSKSIDEQKESLLFLKEKGVLTENEYQEKISIIKNKSILEKVYSSTEYKNLKKVYDSELLTKEHFDSKVDALIEKYRKYISLFGENNYSEFNWKLYDYMELNSKRKTENYENKDLLGNWNFKGGQINFYTDVDSSEKKVEITWDNGNNRFGEWNLNEKQINLKLYKSKTLEINKATLNIQEIGTNIISYTMGSTQYIAYKN